jgi:hypothetical protein
MLPEAGERSTRPGMGSDCEVNDAPAVVRPHGGTDRFAGCQRATFSARLRSYQTCSQSQSLPDDCISRPLAVFSCEFATLPPQHRSYASYASVSDPDGNVWLLQEIKERLPGRGVMMNVTALAQLLHETADHHGSFEAVTRRTTRGSNPEGAAAGYMAEVKHVVVSPA